MAGTSRGLGKGLEALFTASRPQDVGQQDMQGLHTLSLECIHPNPEQPRKHISQEALHELSQSIQEQGLLQPLLVRPHPKTQGAYQIIAGERRWHACQLAGLDQAPVLIRDISDSEALVIGLVENLQRQDLNPVEEAQALGRLQAELQISQDDLAQRIGRSRSAVANSLRLLHLEPEILTALAQGRISSGQARTLLALTDPSARDILFQAALDKQLTVRHMEQAVNHWKAHGRLPASIDPGKRTGSTSSSPGPAQEALQQTLTRHLDTEVRIKGDTGKGRITLPYSSEQELRQLLRKLGVDPEGCFT